MVNTHSVIILGAGASGLSLAHALLDAGVPRGRVLVLEKEAVAGGLSRSEEVDGSPLDIGGGHFLDVRRKDVLDFLFRFLPRHEWQEHVRSSKIRLRGQLVDHPLEANLWQLGKSDQVDFLESIACAGCVRGEPMPARFSDWIPWKLGARIAEEYMLPYNRKLWSMDPDALGTYWLYKLPDVSFRETLRSCLERKPFGTLPAHGRFLYPKHHGYGEVWRRMGAALGDSLVTNCPVERIDLATRTINGRWSADTIVTTIPWTLWPGVCEVPPEARAAISRLRNVSIDLDYFAEAAPDTAHWIYEPDEGISYHRLLLRENFAAGSRGYWTETNAKRSPKAAGWRHHNEYAYPVNTVDKPETIAAIHEWAKRSGVVPLGRWGNWEQMNSDVVVAEAIQVAPLISQLRRTP